jgi:hypothetical protein
MAEAPSPEEDPKEAGWGSDRRVVRVSRRKHTDYLGLGRDGGVLGAFCLGRHGRGPLDMRPEAQWHESLSAGSILERVEWLQTCTSPISESLVAPVSVRGVKTRVRGGADGGLVGS